MTSEIIFDKNIPQGRVLVIDNEGKRVGEFMRDQAIILAKERELSLVQVSDGKIPVCKFLDPGKLAYERKKQAQLAAQNSATNKLKEVRISSVIEAHDMNIKAKKVKEFIDDNCKVKVSLKLEGRHLKMKDIGLEKMQQMLSLLSDFTVIDTPISITGRFVNVTLKRK